jgi:preprotein translocase subunit SecG
MGIISIILGVIFVISALITVLIVLIQDDQGEGIGGMFGGGSSTPFGSRSGNVLTRFTAIVAAVFMCGAFALAWVNKEAESSDIVRKARLESLQEAEQENWWVEALDQPPAPASEPPAPENVQSAETPEAPPATAEE